jgi:galactokinase
VEFTYQSVHNQFTARFKKEPFIVRSPGRINLIGEHTDYNDGFVMPAAIDKEIIFAIAESDSGTSQIVALNFDETVTIDLSNPQPASSPAWANYVLGVLRQIVDRGYALKPFVCVFGGNIPAGSGMSSSAALECGFAVALCELNGLTVSKHEIAKIGQWAEHNFVGVLCGIMDQFANMMGRKDHVIRLDCRSLEFRHFPLQLGAYSIVLFNSGVKHSLASSEYNVRRRECEEGVQILKSKNPSVQSLRDVSVQDMMAHKSYFPENVYKRCMYIVQEIERVQLAAVDLQSNELASFGKRMFETHQGLSELYAVSCDELDYLVNEARKFPEVLGSRLMGGGFGGCTINLVKTDVVESIANALHERYNRTFNISMETYLVKTVDGTGLA